MTRYVRSRILYVAFGAFLTTAQADPGQYRIDVISELYAPVGFNLVDSLNNDGQVVGYYNASESIYSYAAIWDKVSGFSVLDWRSSARGINDYGHMVSGEELRIYDRDGHLLSSYISENGSYGSDINNYDQIAGTIEQNWHKACFWDSVNGLQVLGTLGGIRSVGEAINDAGHVVGMSQNASACEEAFIWDAAGGMRGLGTIDQGSFVESYAYGINNVDMVVGESSVWSLGKTHAFIWDETRGMRDLGSLTSWTSTAYAINDSSWVVGDCWTTTQERPKIAFVWNETMGMMALDNMLTADYQGYQINEAYDINNQGQILAKGTYNDQDYFLLLTPVPEPLGLSLLALGGVALARRRRQR